MDEQEVAPETKSPEAQETNELTAARAELAESRANERAALERLKVALLASEPALESGMLQGETLAEVETSFASATALLAKVRQRAAAETATRVPGGAPGRHVRQPRTPFEKIRDGLSKIDR